MGRNARGAANPCTFPQLPRVHSPTALHCLPVSTLSSQITVLGSQPAVSFTTPAELGNLPELTAELALLESGDSAARFPLALQCSACSSYFVWLATRIRCAEDLDLPRLDELTESVSMLRFNFIATVDEAVWCPSCKRVDDYVLVALRRRAG